MSVGSSAIRAMFTVCENVSEAQDSVRRARHRSACCRARKNHHRFSGLQTAHRWIRIILPKTVEITFEDQKRAIGATYDELMLLGADDLTAVDALFTANSRRSITLLAKTVLNELSRSAPQNQFMPKRSMMR
ncbi:MAG: hypothetical protein U0670_15155 [Anaerolineae bacterium]